MKVVEKYYNTNFYTTRHWNREEATRYVIDTSDGVVEASHFAHYNDEEFVKDVIELPTSYGCPVGYLHCASALLGETRLLQENDLFDIAHFIIEDIGIDIDNEILITYSGIGEGAIAPERVINVSHRLHSNLENSYYTFTTVGFDPHYVDQIDDVANTLPVHYLQISFLSSSPEVIAELVPTAEALGYSLDKLIASVRRVKNITVRFNAVLIKGYNDDLNEWRMVSERMDGLQDRIVWRISQLNETNASIKNDLSPTDNDILFEVKDIFVKGGFTAYVFMSHENDNLNCGQLAWDQYNYRSR